MELLVKVIKRILWQVFRILPIQKNKIVFVSYYGRGYSDNPKYIAEELISSDKKMKYVWVIADKRANDIPKEFIVTKINSISYIYHMSTAKLWIDNARKGYCVKKPGQLYIQTWHGGFGLKKIEKDAEDKLEYGYLKMAKRDASYTDLMISNSKTLTALYRNAFWYSEREILECGLPRNDCLFHYTQDEIAKIRSNLKIPEHVKICLYAPTFRHNGSLHVYDMDYHGCAKALGEHFGGQWIILLRLHPNIFKQSTEIKVDNQVVFNASFYEDIQELYMISDVAITDYSSIMFDFMLTGRPCMLYASDIEAYRKERDYFIPLESLPFPLAQNNAELNNLIHTFDYNVYKNRLEEFMTYHGFCDKGIASQKVVEWINKNM